MQSDNGKTKIAHLVSHPVQYYAPLYQALSERSDVDLTVYFYSDESLREYFDVEFGRPVKWDVPLLDGYKYVLPPESAKRRVSAGMDFRPSWPILQALIRTKPDVIWVNGYQFLNSWLATAIGRAMRIPVFLRDEQNLLTTRASWKRAIKNSVLPLLYRNVWGLYIGENSKKHFAHYGKPRQKLFPGHYCVDNRFFSEHRNSLLPRRTELRAQFGIENDAPVILFSGKLIDKKKPQLLLEAFTRIRKNHNCHLLFVGDGHLGPRLREASIQSGVPDVHWAGFLNQNELPKAYSAADIFVLPSAYQETWGLVVNEAMNFDLPIVVSDHVGCGADLVEEGGNGFRFRSEDLEALTLALTQLVSSAELRQSFGKRSGEIIQNFSLEKVAEEIARACKSARGKSPVLEPARDGLPMAH